MGRSVVEQSKKITYVPGEEAKKAARTALLVQPEDMQCKKCQSYNPEGSAFCNAASAARKPRRLQVLQPVEASVLTILLTPFCIPLSVDGHP